MEQATSTNHHLSWPLALIEALVANLIWGSSFVFVKIALQQGMGPLTVAGLRYFLGFVVLLPFMLRRRHVLKDKIPVKVWLNLAAIGICSYSIGNGAMFWSLKYLPATTVSFMLSLLPLIILAGGALFFSPGLSPGQPAGLAITLFGLAGFAVMGILRRKCHVESGAAGNRRARLAVDWRKTQFNPDPGDRRCDCRCYFGSDTP